MKKASGSRWPWERWYNGPEALSYCSASKKAVRLALAMGEVVQRAGAAFLYPPLSSGQGFFTAISLFALPSSEGTELTCRSGKNFPLAECCPLVSCGGVQ